MKMRLYKSKSYYSEHFVKTAIDLKMGHFYPFLPITRGRGINLNLLDHINEKLVCSLSFIKYGVVFIISVNITAAI